MHDIGTTLKEIREKKGYTLEYVHSELNIFSADLSKVEDNEVDISFKVLERLVNFYGYEVALIHKSHPITRKE